MVRKIYMFIIMLVLLSVFASAAVFISEEEVYTPEGDVYDEDLYVAAGKLDLVADVNGDLIVAGGEIISDASVKQDLMAAGGKITVTNDVADDLRAAGGDILINAVIGGDLIVFGGNIILGKEAVVMGDILIKGGNVEINNMHMGNLDVDAGSLMLNAEITGNASIDAGEIRVRDKAKIGGNLDYKSGEKSEKIESATSGDVKFTKIKKLGKEEAIFFGILSYIGMKLLWMAMLIIIGLIIVNIAPRYSMEIANNIKEKPWHSLGIGFLALIIVPIAAVILLFTIVGIPVGIIVLLLYAIALFLSKIFAILLFGYWLLERYAKRKNRNANYAILLGVVLYVIVVSIPFIGGIICLLSMLLGLGAWGMIGYNKQKILRKKKLI